jgi:RsiW-degrading membrane proteinase PrsW (M82 family)
LIHLLIKRTTSILTVNFPDAISKVVEQNMYRMTFLGGLIAAGIAGTVNFSILFIFNFIQNLEFEIPMPSDVAEAPPLVSAGICVVLSLVEELAKLFGLYFSFRKLCLVPYHEHINNGQFPSVTKTYLAAAVCVGAGFACFENFVYISGLAMEKHRDYRGMSWGELHGVAATRTVMSVHVVWTMITAVVFMQLGRDVNDGILWNFKPFRVIQSVSISWALHAFFNLTVLTIDRFTSASYTLAWAVCLSAAFFLLLRTISRGFFRSFDSNAGLSDAVLVDS